ncbi:glycosyltransferase [bacterium]|nr:glycosyltransferase [bacterium]
MEYDLSRTRVIFEQYVIPQYRVSFFQKLAERVDLVVVASQDKAVDGINDLQHNLPFRTMRIPEDEAQSGWHPSILKVLADQQAAVYVSWSWPLLKNLSDPRAYSELKLLGVKTIWMGCDGYHLRKFWPERLRQLLPWRFSETLRNLRIFSRVDGFVAHSSHMAKYLNLVRFVPRHKITLAHNAVDNSRLTELYHLWNDGKKPRKAHRIVFVGRLSGGKNLKVLLQAFAGVRKSYKDAELVIIGEGSQQEALENQAGRLGLGKALRLKGGIYDQDQLAWDLYQASLFVLPGLGGLGLNSAMAMGLPLVASYADGTEDDLIIPGYNGWRFNDSAQALCKIILEAFDNPERLRVMGKRSATMVEQRFNLDNMIEGYLDRINKVLKQR